MCSVSTASAAEGNCSQSFQLHSSWSVPLAPHRTVFPLKMQSLA